MTFDPSIGGPKAHSDGSLRRVSHAIAAATSVLDPDLVPQHAVDALVRRLGARRADLWRFDGRRTMHVAGAGVDIEIPTSLPSCVSRIARGGISQSFSADELGMGVGVRWRHLLFGMGSASVQTLALVVGEECLGCLTVVSEAPVDQGIDETFSIFAHQVASAMQHAELHRAAQDAALAMRLQNRMLSELTDERDIASLARAIEHLLRDTLGDAGVALLPVDSLGRIVVNGRHGTSPRLAGPQELALLHRSLDASIQTELVTLNSTACASLDLPTWASAKTTTTHATKLSSAGAVTGILVTSVSDGSDSIARRMEQLLPTLAPAAAIALDNARLFQQETQRASRLAAANTLSRTFIGCAGNEDVFQALNIGTLAISDVRRASIYDTSLALIDEQGGRVRGRDAERTLVSTALHRRRPSRVERHDRTYHAIPIRTGERVHAVLCIEHSDSIAPEQEAADLSLLGSVCEHAAATLSVIAAGLDIERNYMDTIQALVHALEARDHYTADHSDVVAQWSLDIGRRLGMNDDELRDLELGAILHDIGKVAIPDSILNKPDRLTSDEFEVMKSHTIIGERILQPIGFLKNVAPIVRHEHERWDGRGYPDGISGTDIPLGSRIIFVCDAYHAITSDRPYRTGQSHAFARRIITENAGSQFDPAVVSVFIEVLDQWLIDSGMQSELDEVNAVGIDIVNGLDGGESDIKRRAA